MRVSKRGEYALRSLINLGIAQELQMTVFNVKNYRRQIRITLQTLTSSDEGD